MIPNTTLKDIKHFQQMLQYVTYASVHTLAFLPAHEQQSWKYDQSQKKNSNSQTWVDESNVYSNVSKIRELVTVSVHFFLGLQDKNC